MFQNRVSFSADLSYSDIAVLRATDTRTQARALVYADFVP